MPAANRALARVTLLCLLWFGMAAPFTHTCLAPAGTRLAAVSDTSPACTSCAWVACRRSVEAAGPPQVAAAPAGPAPSASTPAPPDLSPLPLLPARAPPPAL